MKKRLLYFCILLCSFTSVSSVAEAIPFSGSLIWGGCLITFHGDMGTDGHGWVKFDGGDCGSGGFSFMQVAPGEPVEPVENMQEFETLYEIEAMEGDEDILLACFNEAAEDPNW